MARELIRCSNPECPSRTGPNSALFNLNLVMDAWCDPAENPKKIDPEFYECVHCGDKAERMPEEG